MKKAFISFVLLTIIASCNSVSAQHWSWMNSLYSGSSINPGNRSGAFSWTGQDNKLYLFGGGANNAQGVYVRYNDLWSYDTASAEWTLLGGSEVADAPGIYGQLGVADSNNWPGSRELGAAWADGSGNLWLFGGLGFDASNQSWWLNDLWKYDIASGLWTWVGGSDSGNSIGSYGQIGIGLESNVPAARHLCTYWQNNDDFYVMGGIGTGAGLPGGYLNDLWKFSTGTGVWTLLSGDNLSIYYPNYGEQNIPSLENNPGSRFGASGWISDNGDTLFLFGGGNFNSEIVFYNDLWQFDIPTLTWTWISGSNVPQNQGEYGAQGVASITNNPPARMASVPFHHNEYLWLFGGASFLGFFNDLWKLNKTTREWTWVSGSNSVNDPGAYLEENPDYPFNYPSSRNYAAAWTISETENWIYGGSASEPFDDLWVLDLVGVYSYFLDSDGDGYGDPAFEIQSSTPVQGYVLNSEDCCDSNSNINPLTAWWADIDGDGYGSFVYEVGCILSVTCDPLTWPAQMIPYSSEANNNEPYPADCDDNAPNVYIGAPCFDFNPLTINDVFDASCACTGTPLEVGVEHTCGAPLVHNPDLSYGSMTDQEGNVYKTIVIGDQEWMAENLKVSHYANGDTISSLTNDADWFSTNTGAWCYFNNDSQYDCPYGKLYNWYATVDNRSLCPSNWHVPTYGEWWELIAFLGGQEAAGGLLKSSGNSTTGNGIWNDPNLGGTNGSGFSAIPSGNRVSFGLGFGIGSGAGWWTSTIEQIESAWAFYILNDISDVRQYFGASQRFGFSMRCVRNEDTGLIPGCTDPLACNYEDTATIDNGSCLYPGFSCDDENILTENDTLDDSCTCIGTPITGCTDPLASNYNPLATINEGCEYIVTVDTLICNQITTPTGPGADWGLWLNGLYNAGLASTDWYRWSNFPSLVFSNDGGAHLVGDVVANNNLSNGWHVDITLEEGVDWSTWSAEGGLYIDNFGLGVTTHTSWSFYKLVAGESRLEGFGDFDGDLLFLSHQPTNYSYGWQFGMGANNRNSNNGGSGWLFYTGVIDNVSVNSHGSLTLDMACNYPESYSLNIFVYNDLNGNGAHDIDEPGLSNWPVMGNSIDGLLWTNNNGYYYLTLDTAQYEFTLLNTNDNWVSTTATNVTIDLTSGPATASFGLQVVPGEAIIGASPFTGFWDILHCTQGYESGVYLENIGSQAVSGFMTLTCDPLFTPDADSYFTTPPVEVGPGYALWNVEDFQPGEYELLSFHIDGPGVEYLNQSFTFAFDLTLFDPQGNMIYSDNWSVSPIVACAYDPNDITGFPAGLSAPHEEGYTIEHYILPDNMVEFRVRFQNTGTLPAEDIDIYIPIDPNQWELNTIFPLMRSAEMQVICLHDDGLNLSILEHELPEGVTAQDLLIFSFDDIYLPDSASNPEGSQGYVYFRMQAKHTLSIGDEINAQAFIYFEQNPAVETNETYHVIFDCTSFTPMVGDTELCDGDNLQFSASQPNVDDYSWNIGSLEGTGNIFLFEDIDAGEYTLELNTSNMLCPQGEDHQVNVIVHDIPQLDVPLDETVCEGEELTYEAESDGDVSWSNGASTGDVFTAEESFTVTATAVGAGGCSTSEDWTVTVNPLPSALVDVTGNVFTAQDGTSWQWTLNGTDLATTQSITAEESGNYQVEITNEFGCTSTSESLFIENVFVHSWSTLALFPNPMTTSARLELPQGAFDIALYDLTGACVRTMSKQQGTVLIDRESLARGVYQMRISSSNDNRSIRLVIE